MATRQSQAGTSTSLVVAPGLTTLPTAGGWLSAKQVGIASSLFPDKVLVNYSITQGTSTVGNQVLFYLVRTDNASTPNFTDGNFALALANGPCVVSLVGSALTITAITNTSPPTLTIVAGTAPATGQTMSLSGVVGAASVLNGSNYLCTNLTSTTWTLQTIGTGANVAAPGAYTSGGTATVLATLQANATAALQADQLQALTPQPVSVTSTGYVYNGSIIITDPGPYWALYVVNSSGASLLGAAITVMPITDSIA